MKDDLIKRSDAIAEIRKARTPDVASHQYAELFINAVRRVPSADRPQGKWEEKETFSVVDDNPIIERWQSARCSMCERYHTTPYMYYFNDYNYCPYCGSRMKGADDE